MIRYHSAMKKYGGVAKSSDKDWGRYAINGNIVLHHNICDAEVPEDFYKADAVFSVMAWRAGYKHFVNGTIADNTNFAEYCDGIRRTVNKLNKPTFIITNKTFANKLLPERLVPIRFDRFSSDDLCAVWNYSKYVPQNTTELMAWMGKKYNTVLDFCCGYGEIMYYVNKVILSDINTGCLDYIKEVLENRE